jgi:hypothetical protein
MTGEGCSEEDLWEVEVEVVVVAVGGRDVVEGGESGFDGISNRGRCVCCWWCLCNALMCVMWMMRRAFPS